MASAQDTAWGFFLFTQEEKMWPDETGVSCRWHHQPSSHAQQAPPSIVAEHHESQWEHGGSLHTCSQDGWSRFWDPQVEIQCCRSEERKEKKKQNAGLKTKRWRRNENSIVKHFPPKKNSKKTVWILQSVNNRYNEWNGEFYSRTYTFEIEVLLDYLSAPLDIICIHESRYMCMCVCVCV